MATWALGSVLASRPPAKSAGRLANPSLGKPRRKTSGRAPVITASRHVGSMDKSLYSASFWQRQAITAKVTFPSLSVTRHVLLFQECFHSNIKIDFEIFRFIRKKCISSYCKRNNSMIYRIIWDVFFYSMSSAWKVQIIHILHHVKVSQALLQS